MATNLDQAILGELKALRSDLMKAINSNKYKPEKKDKSNKEQEQMTDNLSKVTDAYKAQNDILKKTNTNLDKFTKSLSGDVIPSLRRLTNQLNKINAIPSNNFRKNNNKTQNSASQTKAFYNLDSKLNSILKILNTNNGSSGTGNGLGIGTGVGAGGLGSKNQILGQLARRFKTNFGTEMIDFVTKSVPKAANQWIKDYQTNRKFGIGGTTYSANIANMLGMTEAERSEMIGKNMQVFKLLGKGNVNAPFTGNGFAGSGSDISALQKNMLQQFGLYGKEAMEEVVKNMNAVFSSSFAVTTDNLKNFNDNLAAAAALAGEAPDDFRAFYKELGDTGQIALMRQSMQDKTDQEQQTAIIQNTAMLLRVNKNLGMNIDEIKKQNQANFNAAHADIVGTIMQNVARSGFAAHASRVLGVDVDKDKLALSETAPEDIQKVIDSKRYGDETQTRAAIASAIKYSEDIRKQMADKGSEAFTQGVQANGAAGGRLARAAFYAPEDLIFNNKNPNYGREAIEKQVKYEGTAKANDTWNNAISPVFESLDTFKKTISDGRNGVVEALIEFKNMLNSITNNPAGGLAADVTKGLAGAGIYAAVRGLMKKVISSSVAEELGITANAATGGGKIAGALGGAKGVLGSTARVLGGAFGVGEMGYGAYQAMNGDVSGGIVNGGLGLLDTAAAYSKNPYVIGGALLAHAGVAGVDYYYDQEEKAFMSKNYNEQIETYVNALTKYPKPDSRQAKILGKMYAMLRKQGITDQAIQSHIDSYNTYKPSSSPKILGPKDIDGLSISQPSTANFSDVKSNEKNTIENNSSISQPLNTTQQRANYIGNALMQKLGLSANGAAGAIGNGIWESGGKLDPKILGDNNTSMGMFQWHNERMQNLLNSANPYTVEGQTDFLINELQNKFPELVKRLQDPNISKADATRLFQNMFENPLDKTGSLQNRINAANIYQPNNIALNTNQTTESTNNPSPIAIAITEGIKDAFSLIGIKLDKIHDVNAKQLDVAKQNNIQTNDQAQVQANIDRFKDKAKNAQQAVFTTLASHNVSAS